MNKHSQSLPRMDIYANHGTKVIFDMPTAGYPHHQETALKHLEIGKVYTIDFIEVHSYSTDVYLVGFTQHFNSVLFGSLSNEDIASLNS